jgi:hypothetical protein
MRDAVIYAYPLVLMQMTKDAMTSVSEPKDGRAPVNQFAHIREWPNAATRDVVRPNVDTLYSYAWLDLKQEPVVLSVPDTLERYYVMLLLDAWSNVFASPGKRTTGTKAGIFAIVGPGWRGALPAGVTEIRSPTTAVWLIGRTQCHGMTDLEEVHRLQDEFKLAPLSVWHQSRGEFRATRDMAQVELRIQPVEQIARLSAKEFLERFAEDIRANPPPADDAATVRKFEEIGIEVGREFDPARLDQQTWRSVELGMKEGFASIEKATGHEVGRYVNGWHMRYDLGSYGTRYFERAVVARVELGASLLSDGFYPTADRDRDGVELSGENSYVLHFAGGELPPVNAFWSITVYDQEHFLVANPLGRYALGDRDPLVFNADGSLDLYLSQQSPGEAREANWLPTPVGPFSITLRAYWPSERILNGLWTPPPVVRISWTSSTDPNSAGPLGVQIDQNSNE